MSQLRCPIADRLWATEVFLFVLSISSSALQALLYEIHAPQCNAELPNEKLILLAEAG